MIPEDEEAIMTSCSDDDSKSSADSQLNYGFGDAQDWMTIATSSDYQKSSRANQSYLLQRRKYGLVQHNMLLQPYLEEVLTPPPAPSSKLYCSARKQSLWVLLCFFALSYGSVTTMTFHSAMQPNAAAPSPYPGGEESADMTQVSATTAAVFPPQTTLHHRLYASLKHHASRLLLAQPSASQDVQSVVHTHDQDQHDKESSSKGHDQQMMYYYYVNLKSNSPLQLVHLLLRAHALAMAHTTHFSVPTTNNEEKKSYQFAGLCGYPTYQQEVKEEAEAYIETLGLTETLPMDQCPPIEAVVQADPHYILWEEHGLLSSDIEIDKLFTEEWHDYMDDVRTQEEDNTVQHLWHQVLKGSHSINTNAKEESATPATQRQASVLLRRNTMSSTSSSEHIRHVGSGL
jgi:hypothetical protein